MNEGAGGNKRENGIISSAAAQKNALYRGGEKKKEQCLKKKRWGKNEQTRKPSKDGGTGKFHFTISRKGDKKHPTPPPQKRVSILWQGKGPRFR